MSNPLLRLKSWAHWIRQEKEPNEDRLLMANDILKLISIAEAARDCIENNMLTGKWEMVELEDALEELKEN